MGADVSAEADRTVGGERRDAVLEAALLTFARFGYRKTSMEQVARAARISRPGLYFLFASKEALFRAAVTRSLEDDLAAAAEALGETDRPLPDRVLAAFDHWAGRYVGPISQDVPDVIEENPDLLGEVVRTAPRRFAELLTGALEASHPGRAEPVASTLISVSVGLKHQVGTRQDYLERLATAIDLVLG